LLSHLWITQDVVYGLFILSPYFVLLRGFGEHLVGRLSDSPLVSRIGAEPFVNFVSKPLGALLGIHFSNQRTLRDLDTAENRIVPARDFRVPLFEPIEVHGTESSGLIEFRFGQQVLLDRPMARGAKASRATTTVRAFRLLPEFENSIQCGSP
jgi:hypothetical protein